MKPKDASKYCSLMEEAKRRTGVIDALHIQQINLLYKATSTEAIYLQFRKILELIAFGSLIVNKEIYSFQYKKFASTWNAELLLKDLNHINPDFYPVPISQTKSKVAGIKSTLEKIEDGYLTRADFSVLYKRCGGILHSENPFGASIDYDKYFDEVLMWRNKIGILLNCHSIKLFNQTGFYLIQMGSEGEKPTSTQFEFIKEIPKTA